MEEDLKNMGEDVGGWFWAAAGPGVPLTVPRCEGREALGGGCWEAPLGAKGELATGCEARELRRGVPD